jgi:hypothetical protein
MSTTLPPWRRIVCLILGGILPEFAGACSHNGGVGREACAAVVLVVAGLSATFAIAAQRAEANKTDLPGRRINGL